MALWLVSYPDGGRWAGTSPIPATKWFTNKLNHIGRHLPKEFLWQLGGGFKRAHSIDFSLRCLVKVTLLSKALFFVCIMFAPQQNKMLAPQQCWHSTKQCTELPNERVCFRIQHHFAFSIQHHFCGRHTMGEMSLP